ncbi:hypothetical protein [Pararhodobacter sp.]|uniref:hypothetical protein n=1 Tax=Pararhodobacter sp. TaxID=2127056 RepID=UPI002FDD5804
MANRTASLRQSDLTRYLKAMQKAGIEGGRIEVKPDGTHVIIPGKVDLAFTGPDPDELLR